MHSREKDGVKLDRGILAALAAAALFGLSTPIAKTLLGAISPLLLAGLLYMGSGIGLAIVLSVRAISQGRASIVRPRGLDLVWLLGAIVLGGALGPYLLMYGLQMTDSASASLILNLEGVFTALLAWFAFKENFDRRIAAGMALIVAGGVVLSMGSSLRASDILGLVAIAGACLAWAMDNNLTRKVSISDAMLVACIKGLIAGPISVALSLRYGAHLPSAILLIQGGLLGFVGYGLSPDAVCCGTAKSRHRKSRRLFFGGSFYRRGARRGVGRAVDVHSDDCRTLHGSRSMVAFHRKPCPSPPPLNVAPRAFACSRRASSASARFGLERARISFALPRSRTTRARSSALSGRSPSARALEPSFGGELARPRFAFGPQNDRD